MYQLGVKDEVLRRELCKVRQPNLAEFDAILEAHALMEASERLRGKTAQSNRAAGQAKKPPTGSSSSPSNPQRIKITEEEKSRRKAIRGKCYRCASGDHMIPGIKKSLARLCASPATIKATLPRHVSSHPLPGRQQLILPPIRANCNCSTTRVLQLLLPSMCRSPTSNLISRLQTCHCD